MKSADFAVARNDLQQCKIIETQLPDAASLLNEALLVKVTRFALTANNITYAVLGDELRSVSPDEPTLPGHKPTWFSAPARSACGPKNGDLSRYSERPRAV